MVEFRKTEEGIKSALPYGEKYTIKNIVHIGLDFLEKSKHATYYNKHKGVLVVLYRAFKNYTNRSNTQEYMPTH